MKRLRDIFRPSGFLQVIVAFLIVTGLAVIFDIPVLRPFAGFLFLTFVPGYLILVCLKLDVLGRTEKVVLSVGLSVSFTMLFGLLVNGALRVFGLAGPLGTAPLLISFALATLVLAALAWRQRRTAAFSFRLPDLSIKEKVLLVVPSLLPLLSFAGTRLMDMTGSNILLIAMLTLVSAYFIFVSVYHRKVPDRLYPVIIWLIGISLLLMLALRSNHVIGTDVLEADYVFRTTLDNLRWGVTAPTLISSLLSISLLPAIYQGFLGIGPEVLFKVLFPVIFSVSPLVVYIIARKYAGGFYAFLASFFFMSQFYFIWTTSAPQTNIAILFFALTVLVMFHGGVSEFARRFMVIVFAASCIVSHYSTTYIFFFLLLLTWLGMKILPRLPLFRAGITGYDKGRGGSDINRAPVVLKSARPTLKREIHVTFVILFFMLFFFWYSQVTWIAFRMGVEFIYQTLANLNQWYVMEAKGSTITSAIGVDIGTIPQTLRVVFSWLTVGLIVLGVVVTAIGYWRRKSDRNTAEKKTDRPLAGLDTEYFVLALACGAVLVFTVVLPYVAVGYSLERVYFQAMVVLSPFLVIGGVTLGGWLRTAPRLLLPVILVPFFLGTTGVTYQLSGIPASIALNSSGAEYEHMYIQDSESYAAGWLGDKAPVMANIHTDYDLGPRLLASQGKITPARVRGSLLSDYREGKDLTGYIFLFYPGVVRGEAALPRYAAMDIAPAPGLLDGRNKIYANGVVEIYGD